MHNDLLQEYQGSILTAADFGCSSLRAPLYKYTAEPLVCPAAAEIVDSAKNS